MKPKKQRPQTKKSGLMLETKKSGLALDPKDHQGRLRSIGGSTFDHWNSILVNQATSSLLAVSRHTSSAPEARNCLT
jgi:hypothetical protein